MSSIFEELMGVNSRLTESVRPSNRRSKKLEVKRIPVGNIRVESRKVFEETDYDELDQEFAQEPTEENPDEVVLIIDPELSSTDEVPEDAAEEMVGDLVYKCPVCGSNYVCGCGDKVSEAIELDDEGVPVECPICGDDAEQILVGEIGPVDEAGEKTEPELVDAEDEEDEEEIEDDVDFDEFDEESEDESEEVDEEEDEDKKESLRSRSNRNIRREGKNSSMKNKKFDKKSEDVIIGGNGGGNEGSNDDDIDEFLDIGSPDVDLGLNVGGGTANILPGLGGKESCRRGKNESCDEDYELDLEVPEEEEKEEEVYDESEAPVVEVKDSTVTLVFDDKRFESFMKKVITDNYKGDPSFKVTRCSAKSGKLKIEYLVREGRKVTKGCMIGEGFDKKSRMILKFKDRGAFTESFARTPSFIVECSKIRNVVVPTSVKYDYKVKVNESLYRVYGSLKKTYVRN